MKRNSVFMALAIASLFLASCQKASTIFDIIKDKGKGTDKGYVLTLSNQTSGNKIIAYTRSSEGKLSYAGEFPTGGTGTGSGLGSQGAIVLSDDEHYALAVNAGSNSISSFNLSDNNPKLVSTVASGGTRPISITMHKGLVFVVNAGGTGNISGFKLMGNGKLQPIDNSTRPLSSMDAGPAQISFVADGKVVAITEKNTNKIITYTINAQGIPGMMHSLSSSNMTPFGFAVGHNGNLYVSEAAGGAPGASTVSSYRVQGDGMISLIDGPVSAGQSAACWVVMTKDGRYVYATNTGSHTITSFKTDMTGNLDVIKAVSGMTGMGSSPIDEALSGNNRYLYVLNGGNQTISVFALANDGSLSHIENISGLPMGAVGLAAN
ncbi:MAG: beta-propeller fold lactonase family protein [Chitinophagaceae bacterium]